MSIASTAFRNLTASRKSDLERLVSEGETPSWESISGWSFRGYNYGWIARPLGIRCFIKDFYSPESGERFGRSTVLKQAGLDPFGELRQTGNHVRRRIRYRVERVDSSSRHGRYPNALLLDYRAGGTPSTDPASRLRDFLVRVEPDNDDLLIGKAYIVAGPLWIATGFFLIERMGVLDPSTLGE